MTLNYPDVLGAIKGMVSIQKEIIRDVSQILTISLNTGEAFPFMHYDSEVYPRWVNGVSDAKPEDIGVGEETEPMTILSRLEIGKRTEGFDGDLEQQLWTWIPYTITMFATRPLLTSDAAPDRPKGLLGASMRLYRPLVPGQTVAAEFVTTCLFYTNNPVRTY